MREDRTEVLVVGAGPVGLLTAVLLREAGIEALIIDQENRTAARSYACALHPASLKLLQRLGLAETVVKQGQPIRTVAFYDGEARCAEIDLAQLGGDFPFLLVLPQNALETALEERLRKKGGLPVLWNHRFDALYQEEDAVIATVEELGGTSTGYIVPHWETIVKNRRHIRSDFLVGADGHHSLVRHRLGIDYQLLSGPAFFAAYEFQSDIASPAEVRIVLDQNTSNVLWPLPGGRYRWTFQLVHAELATEFPEKERSGMRFEQKAVDERIRQYVQKVAAKRAPWFIAPVKDIAWSSQVVFEQRLARQFGQGRCWLAGDAAHQTGPVGMQSMNLGFTEAEALASAIHKTLKEGPSPNALQSCDLELLARWRQMLGLTGGLKPSENASPWIRERYSRILPCLPASGEDLARLAMQLGLELA